MSPAGPTGPQVSIVLPAHNEAELLGGTVRDLVKAMRDRAAGFEVIVVENGSTDGTYELARALETELAEVRVDRLAKADYGAAVARGFELAGGTIVVHFDVDYLDLDFLDKGVELIERGAAGIVLASKRAPGATDRRPLGRRLLTAGFTFAMRGLLALPVTDAHGMKVLNRAEVSQAASECKMRGALYDVELVLRATRAGVGIIELPADVAEIRPPRTAVWQRSLESAAGLVRLRILLWREDSRRRRSS